MGLVCVMCMFVQWLAVRSADNGTCHGYCHLDSRVNTGWVRGGLGERKAARTAYLGSLQHLRHRLWCMGFVLWCVLMPKPMAAYSPHDEHFGMVGSAAW